jgi:hypothetical protein
MLNRERQRWEPHIHAPDTIPDNQFGAADPGLLIFRRWKT